MFKQWQGILPSKATPYQHKADPFLEKYPSVRGDTHRDLEAFPKVTFSSQPVHLDTGMHPGMSTLFPRRRRGPYI